MIIINKLNEFIGKKVNVSIKGNIESEYSIQNFEYEFKKDMLKIKDKNGNNFIRLNINQVYDVKEEKNSLKIYLDYDLIITIKCN